MEKKEIGIRTMGGKKFNVTDTDYGPVVVRDYEPIAANNKYIKDYAQHRIIKNLEIVTCPFCSAQVSIETTGPNEYQIDSSLCCHFSDPIGHRNVWIDEEGKTWCGFDRNR